MVMPWLPALIMRTRSSPVLGVRNRMLRFSPSRNSSMLPLFMLRGRRKTDSMPCLPSALPVISAARSSRPSAVVGLVLGLRKLAKLSGGGRPGRPGQLKRRSR